MGPPTADTAVAVTEVAADALGRPLEELPPLSRVVDLDALDQLLASTTSSHPPELTVTFEYAGLTVVVHSHGLVYVTPIDEDSEPAFNGRAFGP